MATPKDPDAVALGHRIEGARGVMPRRLLAGELDVHENTLGKWERGETVPNALQLQQIAKVLQRHVEDLLGETPRCQEERARYKVTPAKRATRARRDGEVVYVPLFDVRSGAPASTLEDLAAVSRELPFMAAQLEEIGIQHNNLVLVRMPGAAIEPEQRADVLLVDLNDRGVLEGPHLVRIDQAMYVKQLWRKPGRLIVSDSRSNDKGASFELALDEETPHFEVLGRCVWAGVTLA